MHISLIDRIVRIEPHQEIQAVKNLSFREDYLRDHFPSFPLMPGALQVEAMIQSAQWLLRASFDFPAADFIPSVISNTRYAKYVRPGDQLLMRVTLTKSGVFGFRFRGTGEVDGARTVQAQFELMRYESSWTHGVSPETVAILLRGQRDTLSRLTSVPAPLRPATEVVAVAAS